MYNIRKITRDEVEDAMKLALEVFMEFEAPDYGMLGVETFKKDFPDKRCRGHKEKNFTIIYKANCPCVLTENFFMDTESDCKFLLSEEGFNRVVDLHVNSIIKYMEKYG